MGYWSPAGRPQIKNYTPDDGENHFYVYDGARLADILDHARVKWGEDFNFERLYISGSTIHTRCLSYDLYDSSDYDDYIMIERLKQ